MFYLDAECVIHRKRKACLQYFICDGNGWMRREWVKTRNVMQMVMRFVTENDAKKGYSCCGIGRVNRFSSSAVYR